jgi:predicted MPP superfamily phosphohydrolase
MAIVSRESETRHEVPSYNPGPGDVRYSRRWAGAAAGGAALAALAAVRGGAPAVAALAAAGLAGGAYATLVEPRRLRLERVTLRFSDLPAGLDGLRIGQISDLHLGHPYSAANARRAAEEMAAERPDLLALTGDFVSYHHAIDMLPDALAPLAGLRPPLGAYAVLGNHDYWEGVPEIRAAMEPLGIEFLVNAGRALRWGGAELALAGVDDLWEGVADLGRALEGFAPDAFTVLLCHCPDLADVAAAAGVRLQLSGHTHGGHMILPGLGSFCLPRHGWMHPAGHEHVGPMQLYVSRGVGGIPLRLGCPPEATLITLRRG